MGTLIAMAYPTSLFADQADHTYVKCGTGKRAWGCWGGKTGGRVLYVERPDWHDELADRDLRYRRGWTITCASVIAYFMALDTRVQTPKGFYELLLRDFGALELERAGHGRRRRRQQSQQALGAAADTGA